MFLALNYPSQEIATACRNKARQWTAEPEHAVPDLHALLDWLYVEHLLCKRDGGRDAGLESSARRYSLSRRIEADSRLLVV